MVIGIMTSAVDELEEVGKSFDLEYLDESGNFAFIVVIQTEEAKIKISIPDEYPESLPEFDLEPQKDNSLDESMKLAILRTIKEKYILGPKVISTVAENWQEILQLSTPDEIISPKNKNKKAKNKRKQHRKNFKSIPVPTLAAVFDNPEPKKDLVTEKLSQSQVENKNPQNPESTKQAVSVQENKTLKTIQKQKSERKEKTKNASMRTAKDVIQRLKWDSSLDREEFKVGYLDRFLGVKENLVFDLNWEDDISTTGPMDRLAIPEHRIQYFKWRDEKIWDKKSRTDFVFNSTGSGMKIEEFIEKALKKKADTASGQDDREISLIDITENNKDLMQDEQRENNSPADDVDPIKPQLCVEDLESEKICQSDEEMNSPVHSADMIIQDSDRRDLKMELKETPEEGLNKLANDDENNGNLETVDLVEQKSSDIESMSTHEEIKILEEDATSKEQSLFPDTENHLEIIKNQHKEHRNSEGLDEHQLDAEKRNEIISQIIDEICEKVAPVPNSDEVENDSSVLAAANFESETAIQESDQFNSNNSNLLNKVCDKIDSLKVSDTDENRVELADLPFSNENKIETTQENPDDFHHNAVKDAPHGGKQPKQYKYSSSSTTFHDSSSSHNGHSSSRRREHGDHRDGRRDEKRRRDNEYRGKSCSDPSQSVTTKYCLCVELDSNIFRNLQQLQKKLSRQNHRAFRSCFDDIYLNIFTCILDNENDKEELVYALSSVARMFPAFGYDFCNVLKLDEDIVVGGDEGSLAHCKQFLDQLKAKLESTFETYQIKETLNVRVGTLCGNPINYNFSRQGGFGYQHVTNFEFWNLDQNHRDRYFPLLQNSQSSSETSRYEHTARKKNYDGSSVTSAFMYHERERINKDKEWEVTVSKKFSAILRHNAYGFQVDEYGFVLVNEILRHKLFRRMQVTEEDVINIVMSNEKKRFALEGEEGNLKMRANQGHTVKVENLHLLQIKDPDEYPSVVHGTYMQSWPSIRKSGLQRMKRNHIHLTTSEPTYDCQVLSGMRKSCNCFIYIDIAKAMRDGIKFFLSDNGVILTEGNDGVLDPTYFAKVHGIYDHQRHSLPVQEEDAKPEDGLGELVQITDPEKYSTMFLNVSKEHWDEYTKTHRLRCEGLEFQKKKPKHKSGVLISVIAKNAIKEGLKLYETKDGKVVTKNKEITVSCECFEEVVHHTRRKKEVLYPPSKTS